MSSKNPIIRNDFKNKAVIITGGTKGVGLACGLAFGRLGAHAYLTHRWGSADEEAIRRRFAEEGAPEPEILEADVSQDEDTDALLARVKEQHDGVEVLISNVGFSQVIKKGVRDYKKRRLLTSLGYSTWPFVSYFQKITEVFGRYPRYALGMSNDGSYNYIPGYDFVAVTKVVMEVLGRYMAAQMMDEDCRVNVLRFRGVVTESLVATFGEEFEPFHRKYYNDDYFIEVEEVADAALALCSGLMDAVRGQEIMLDRGVAFCDNLYRLYEHREEYGL